MGKKGVLVISHGSRDADWIAEVDKAVYAARLPSELPLESAFLELVEGRLIQDGIERLEERGVDDIAVIPLFISSGSTHVDEIRRAFGIHEGEARETPLAPFRFRSRIRFGQPIDDDPVIAGILQEKLAGLSEDPKQEVVLLVGHGSSEDAFRQKWSEGLTRLAARLQTIGGFAAVETALLLPDQVGERLEELNRRYDQYAVLVAPLFLSEGYFTRTALPSRLQSHRCLYNGKALLPSARISEWIERQVEKELEIDLKRKGV